MLSNNIYNVDLFLNQNIFRNKIEGKYIDIGNTDISYFFQKNFNWKGILIEPNKSLIPYIKANRANNIIYNGTIGNLGLKDGYIYDNKCSFKYKIKSQIQPIQQFEYQQITNNQLYDLVIINNQYNQIDIVNSINKASNKPNYIVIEYSYDNKKEIQKNICKNYQLLYDYKSRYLIYKRIPYILLITRCTRIENLIKIKKSIDQCFKDPTIKYFWYILVQGKKVSKADYGKYIDKFKQENIKYFYTVGTGHYLFSGQFLNFALNDQQIINCDYSYILDDDNIMHKNFCIDLKEYINDRKQVIIMNMENYLGDIKNLTVDCRGKIDNGNFLIRTDILRTVGGYQITPSHVTTGWAEDAATIKHLIQKEIPLTYTHKICAFYNGIQIFD